MDMPVESLRQHLIDPELCARCNSCEETCRHGAISHDAVNYVIDPARCVGSMECLSACSTGAIDSWRLVPHDTPYDLAQQFAWTSLPAQDPALRLPSAASSADRTGISASGEPHHAPPRAPRTAPQAVVNRFIPSSPTCASILRNEMITRPADGAEVRHVVLEFADDNFPVLEGQSLGIIPPGRDDQGREHHVRLYSVASARDGETRGRPRTVALTIKRVLQDHEGHAVRGVCSNYVCDLPPGAQLRVTGPVGASFLMPDERGTPLLMICTGTGIAPMRAIIERRARLADAAARDLLLFYGGRSEAELPYLEDLRRLAPASLDLNVALSRVPGASRRYVQDVLCERAAAVAELVLERKACVYVCGLREMEHGVRAVLHDVFAARGYDGEQQLRNMTTDGRFHVEVY